MVKDFIYSDDNAKEISFPLGGIGSGCIGLAGNGRLIDTEIFNKPAKGTHAGFTHFAVKAEDETGLADARILMSDIQTSHMGVLNGGHFNSFGFGPDRATLMGLPHFKDSTFRGRFPFAELAFEEARFPGKITMTAFNPFIPLNDKDSSIPTAMFSFEIENTGKKTMDYSLAFSAVNLYSKKGGIHTYSENGALKSIHLKNNLYPENDVRYGDMSISTDAEDVSRQLYWYRGSWFDNLATYWSDFAKPGRLKDRYYDPSRLEAEPNYAAEDVGTLMARVTIKPGEKKQVRFVLTWNTPNVRNYWNPVPCDCEGGCCETEKTTSEWRNYYATLFDDSLNSAEYTMGNFDRFYNETAMFCDTLFGSSLPEEVIDAVSANLSVIKSPTCLRLEDGSLYGFEGCHCDSGCCEGSCTHVWSYTYAIPFLFPKLERSMRSLEYKHSLHEDGWMAFRLGLPAGRVQTNFRPCVDGQYATVMRVLREYKISGDKEWLASIWGQVKRTIEFAWHPNNFDMWDPDKSGIMTGRQHHTLDMELFGENAWLSGLYLGGLRAGAELAKIMDEEDTAALYMSIFERGRAKLNAELFNGEYFYHKIDLKDKSQLDKFKDANTSLFNRDIYAAYWNEEQEEVTYQTGEGCSIDQVLAQWHADLIGLGEIFETGKTKKALASIYKNNYIENMREHVNPCRLYCINDEGGLIICSYPEGAKKPFITAPYSEETMHGFEYSAASHMIMYGMVEEGLTCIRALRDRYDGSRRNPWNEFECGSNYARSMSSYALLLIYSGFRYDMSRGMLGFAPITDINDFRSFWSLDSAWGEVVYAKDSVTIKILAGNLSVSALSIEKAGRTPKGVTIDGHPADFSMHDGVITLTIANTGAKEIVISY